LGGYTDTQQSEDVFSVYFEGSPMNPKPEVADLCMLRAAEVTLDNEYSFFAILSDDDSSVTSSYVSGGGGYTNVMTGAYVATPVTGSSSTFYSSTIKIQVSKEKINGRTNYDALFLYRSLSKKYNVEPKRY
jgi:hypothetical protein